MRSSIDLDRNLHSYNNLNYVYKPKDDLTTIPEENLEEFCMETTRDERSRGILMIRAMTLKDFLTLIDRKTEEFEDKAAAYMDECNEDLNLVQDMPPFEIQTCIRFHEIYLQKFRDMLAELKKTAEKNLDSNHMVPVRIVELYVTLARKATMVKYTKIAPSLQRVN